MNERRPTAEGFLESARAAHLADRGDRARARKGLEAKLLLPPLIAAPLAANPPPVAPAAPAAPPAPVAPPPSPVAAPLPGVPQVAAASSGALLAAKKVLIGAALFASGGASTMVYERVASDPAPHVASAGVSSASAGRGLARGSTPASERPAAPSGDAAADTPAAADDSAAPVAADDSNAPAAVPSGEPARPVSPVPPVAPGVRGGEADRGVKAVRPVAEAPTGGVAKESSAPVPAATEAPAAPSSRPAVASTVAEELRLVRDAQAQLRAGRAEGALALLAEHARAYPQGALREERAASRVLALCALGRGEQARREADAFVAASPRSPYAGGLRRPCGGQGGR